MVVYHESDFVEIYDKQINAWKILFRLWTDNICSCGNTAYDTDSAMLYFILSYT